MQTPTPRVAVTGATGLLGRYLVEALGDDGVAVVGVVRAPDRGTALEARGIPLRVASLGNRASLGRAFAGIDVVVHAAALYAPTNLDPDAHERVNVRGAVNVVDAAHAAGAQRLVHVSTVAAYDAGAGERVTAQTPLRTEAGRQWVYAASKARGEEAVRGRCAEHGIALTVVRPGPMYGRGDRVLVPWVKRAMALPFLPVPAIAVPSVHAGDVAEAIARAVLRPDTVHRTYDLTGPPHTLDDLLAAWRAVTGRAPRALRAPRLPAPPRFDPGPAERDLGFTCRSLEAGLREVLQDRRPGPTARSRRSRSR